jgi:hypothetical protein
MTISEVVMRVFDSAKPAKKKRAAMFGPSSMMSKLSVRKEFIADSAMASTMCPPQGTRGSGRHAAVQGQSFSGEDRLSPPCLAPPRVVLCFHDAPR